MKYRSTRGTKQLSGLTFEETLFCGWLDDGGLVMPENIPTLSPKQMTDWSGLTYKDLCLELLSLFIGEGFIEREELKNIISRAYSCFPNDDVVPLVKLDDKTFVAELFHGPTLAFKDLSMVISTELLNYALKKRNKHGIVYACTMGDTGSSINCAARGLPNIDTVILFAGGDRMTKVQRLLITTTDNNAENNVHNYVGDCYCDPFDVFLQSFSRDLKASFPQIVVTSLNSIIFIRVLAQSIHFIYCYYQTRNRDTTDRIRFVVPTGGCGHLTSAVIVQKLGFPVSIVPVFNDKNPNTYNFMMGNTLVRNAPVSPSLSVAMDMQVATNIDRLLYIWSDYDVELVNTLMKSFDGGAVSLTANLLDKLRESIDPMKVSDDDIKQTMRTCYQTKSYALDPHTAAGFTHYYKHKESKDASANTTTTIYMGCASPVKFPETMKLVEIPLSVKDEKYIEELYTRKEYYKKLPSNENQWKDFLLSDIREIIKKRLPHTT